MTEARELLPIIADNEAMRLELLARVDILNHHLRTLAEGVETARRAGALFQTLEVMMKTFAEELDHLAETVKGISGVVPSVVAALGEVAGKFRANANDADRVRQLADEVDTMKVTLATAVAAVPADTPAPTPAPAAPTDGTAAAPADGAAPTDPPPQ